MEIGETRHKYKSLKWWLLGTIVPVYLGLIIGQYMPVSKLIENVNNINWFHFEITEYSGKTVVIFLMIYFAIALSSFDPGKFRAGEEFGSARWLQPKVLSKYRRDENKEYKEALKHLKKRLLPRSSPEAIPDMKPVTSPNRILSEHVSFDIDTNTSKMNANTIGIGSPGSWKTTSLVYTNMMQMSGSMVICDPKGETTERCAMLGEQLGYKVKVLDLKNMDQSDCFNPFDYVENDEDIVKMVSFAFRGFDADKKGESKDPFWDDANMLEMCAVCYLLWYDARKEDQTLPMALKLVNLNSIEVTKEIVKRRPTGEKYKVKEKKTGLAWLFYDYAQRHGEDNMPMTYYRLFNKAKDKTLANMETTLVAKLQMLMQPKVMRLLSKDELKLHDIGREPQLLFLKVPENDSSFNFLISMVYCFLYKALYHVSDVEYHGSGLPIPVTILEDEFTSFPQPNDFLTIMATCRGRNIGIFPIFQDIVRLKQMKSLGDVWGSVFGQADSIILLGTNEPETAKFFVDNYIGKETIEYRTRSRQGYSTQKTGRELATIDEIMAMPKDKCIIKFAGERPVVDTKYPFLKHPNIKLTAIPRDGSGQKFYIHKPPLVEPDNVEIEVYKPDEKKQVKDDAH